MTQFDLTPYRSSIGLDRMAHLMDSLVKTSQSPPSRIGRLTILIRRVRPITVSPWRWLALLSMISTSLYTNRC